MVIAARAGKSVRKGMNTTFLEAMHGKKGSFRLIAALIISFGITIPLLWLSGIATVMAAILTSLFIVFLSHIQFKGITGDVFGAINELSRMTSIIVLLAMVRWV
jgi:adenosylcobinamide-GDP ribazoletransferase